MPPEKWAHTPDDDTRSKSKGSPKRFILYLYQSSMEIHPIVVIPVKTKMSGQNFVPICLTRYFTGFVKTSGATDKLDTAIPRAKDEKVNADLNHEMGNFEKYLTEITVFP